MKAAARFDYTTVGHVTLDVMADGSRRPGGTAFYSALQAARLGLRALILTRGVPAEIEALLAPYRGELALEVQPAEHTTTLATEGSGNSRRQRLLSWAGPLGEEVGVDSAILHLAPVARETSPRWRGRAGFVGLTPQGLVRSWSEADPDIVHVALDERLLPDRCDAIVFGEAELDSCAELLAPAPGRRDSPARAHVGGPVAVTAGAAPTLLCLPDGGTEQVIVPAVGRARDDVGAGDVFAAAFFVALAGGAAPEQAAALAGAAAAVRVEGDGPGAIGTREQVQARVDAGREGDAGVRSAAAARAGRRR